MLSKPIPAPWVPIPLIALDQAVSELSLPWPLGFVLLYVYAKHNDQRQGSAAPSERELAVLAGISRRQARKILDDVRAGCAVASEHQKKREDQREQRRKQRRPKAPAKGSQFSTTSEKADRDFRGPVDPRSPWANTRRDPLSGQKRATPSEDRATQKPAGDPKPEPKAIQSIAKMEPKSPQFAPIDNRILLEETNKMTVGSLPAKDNAPTCANAAVGSTADQTAQTAKTDQNPPTNSNSTAIPKSDQRTSTIVPYIESDGSTTFRRVPADQREEYLTMYQREKHRAKGDPS